MNFCQTRHPVCRFTTIASLAALTVSIAVAQTTTPPSKTNPVPPKTAAKPAPVVPAKPAAVQVKPPAAQPVSQTTNASTIAKRVNAAATTPLPTVTPSANQSVQSATGTTPQAPTQTVPNATAPSYTSAPSYAAPASNALSTASPAVNSAGGDPRTPVAGQGIGTFLWPGGWTLIAYGCFRSGTRLFCDFDTTNQNNIPVNTGNFWMGGGGVNIVDDGGKITGRHNAFFVGTDGSQFDTAYVSPQPVRFIIEYDNVDQSYTQISLILGRDRIQNVPITLIDPSQPAGKMPARTVVASAAGKQPAAGAPGTQAAAAGANGAIDQANNTVNNISNQKKRAQSLLKSLQTAVQSH